ncbi:hypothetical protein NDK47_25860 [Brevibacillus ruminantium]|uniref:Uncharacterized protein n=1 Tax=Brevibacillus ruminantium TaxID=2950604 RepID=A0ABY4WF69_9BACL|nr:hypothetical protein [Brevibacillus ruminantium]USG65491.1 hypothetical protein NDK47_25860 [Brevibacillus ruminantium]
MYRKILFALFLCLILFGCQPKEINDPSEPNITTNEDNALITFIHQKTDEQMGFKVEDFKIVKVSHIENSAFGQLLFKKNNIFYEGLFYTEKINASWDIVHLETTQMDSQSPFTKMQLAGKLRNKESSFHIVSGIIHDKRIKSIQITYPNNESSIIMIDNDDRYYFDVKIGVSTFSTIVAYDDSHNEISS